MDKLKVGRVLVGLTFSVAAWAQGLSTINGSVADPSGSVIPAAKITVIEVETSLPRKAVTNAEGNFVISSLRPTHYRMIVEAPGFRTFNQTGITLLADDSITFNVKLELGSTTEIVNVEASAVQVDTTTGTLRQVVDSGRMVELPLNGRNPAQLTALVAGAVSAPSDGGDQGPTKTFPGAVTISVNGGRSNNVSYRLDGVHSQDILSNVNQPLPMPDALQEFSVQTSNYSAEYGETSAGVVNVVTKSGTNALHGSALGFLRNAVLNARNFFAADRDQLKRGQFGGTLGGPIIRDKAFFFGSYQGTRIRNLQGGLSSFVPTAANRAGDFSAYLDAANPNNAQGRSVVVRDPSNNNQPFAGNIIPVSRFDPAYVAMLKFLPISTAGNGLAFYSRPIIQDYDSYLGRVDYSPSSNDRLMVRYNLDYYNQPAVFADNNLLTYTTATPDVSYNAAIQHTHIFSSSLLNDFRFGVTRVNTQRQPPPNTPSVQDFGVNIYQGPSKTIEGISASGYFSFGDLGGGHFGRATFAWYDTVRWVKGRHNISLGGSFERDRWNKFNDNGAYGKFSFTGDITGSALADLTLGRLRTFTQGNGQHQVNRAILYSIFFNDNFKASRRLNLSYGMRYEPSLPWHAVYGDIEVFRPDLYASGIGSKVYVNVPPGLMFSGDPQIYPDGRSPDYNNFAPRLGFAYDVFGDGKTSLRGGGGVFLNSRVPGSANASQSQISPFNPTVTLTNPAGPFSNPYQGINNPFPLPFPTPKNIVVPTPIQVYSWDPFSKLITPTIYNYNLTIEHQLTANWLVRAAHVGSRTTHWSTNVEFNPSLYVPGSTLGTDARRYYQPYGSIRMNSPSGNAWYHAMQLSLEKRFSAGFTILANYTWSKSLDNLPFGLDNTSPMLNAVHLAPPTVKDFKSLDRGPSDTDINHVLVTSYLWSLPSLSHANRWVHGAIGGWQASGILSVQTGPPLTMRAGVDRSSTGIGSDSAQLLSPNVYGPGACRNSAPCVDSLVPSAFGLPAVGTFGNIAKGALRGPGLFNWDMGIAKHFSIKERWGLQFRAEFFNASNRVNLNGPATSVNGAGFGAIRSGRDPRIGQIALKLSF